MTQARPVQAGRACCFRIFQKQLSKRKLIGSRVLGKFLRCVHREFTKGVQKNSEFAQLQGAEKSSPRRILMICKLEVVFRNAA
jgi:hypothetical protein